MHILNSTAKDTETIFGLYRMGAAYMKSKGLVSWPDFEPALVEKEIAENRQWKMILEHTVGCVWATTFSDPEIWEERNTDPAVYIHRIATHPAFRGRHLVTDIVNWAREYAVEHEKQYIRMDTVSENHALIKHYQSCGFNYLGLKALKNTEGLPSHYTLGPVCLFEIKL